MSVKTQHSKNHVIITRRVFIYSKKVSEKTPPHIQCTDVEMWRSRGSEIPSYLWRQRNRKWLLRSGLNFASKSFDVDYSFSFFFFCFFIQPSWKHRKVPLYRINLRRRADFLALVNFSIELPNMPQQCPHCNLMLSSFNLNLLTIL